MTCTIREECSLPLDSQVFRQLLAWYEQVRQPLPWRLDPSPYRIWISEIMLQQTVITTVIPYFERWMKTFPDVYTLARADEPAVLLLWEGLGYYNRARNMLKTARQLVSRFNGEIPSDYETLVKLPGIGDYTASAILSIAYGLPHPVLDANVRRIFQRLLNLEDINSSGERQLKNVLKELMTAGLAWYKQLSAPVSSNDRQERRCDRNAAGDFNEALMQLGQTVCRRKQPLCTGCCLAPFCRAFHLGTQERIPAVRRQTTIARKTALFIFLKGNTVWLTRKLQGPLRGLWSFPAASYEEREGYLQGFMASGRNTLTFIKALTACNHYYTSYKDELFPVVYRLEGTAAVPPLPEFSAAAGAWITVEELKNYPFPSVYRKIIGELAGLEKINT